MADERPSRLGRGLSALFGDESQDYADLDRVRATKSVPIGDLQPSRVQPRRRFDDAEIHSLIESIREQGILQPILVRRLPENPNRYEIVAGERRWRAAQKAQIHEVPVIVKELTDGDALQIALVENLQRQDLTALEEGEGYRRLMEDFGRTQDEVARIVSKSRSHVANTLRLLSLPEPVKEMLEDGRLTAGHARALLNAAEPEKLAREVVRRGLNVRQAEALVQRGREGPRRPRPRPEKDPDTKALEWDLSVLLGMKVNIGFHGKGGTLTIHYDNLEQLDDVLHRLTGGGRGRPGGPGSAEGGSGTPAPGAG